MDIIGILKTEIDTDPLARGYDTMTDVSDWATRKAIETMII